jgi:Rps23 Pro-64 3,4-dihydroxylase Tpa1-like proline 4-hydroxylase
MIISDIYADPSKLSSQYRSNSPFPHIVLDDFISKDLLNSVSEEFPDLKTLNHKIEYSSQKEVKLASSGSSELSPSAKVLINFLNSDIFLEYLQRLTGISEPLISDPYLSGGGYHEIKTGGVLKVHADFNKHPKLDLDRRLNLLLYLNKDWDSSWGGNLELYKSDDLSSPAVSIEPIFNRCVIFTTTSFTFHGHPEPLTCPEGRSRKSIALYYFSTGRPKSEVEDTKHSTLFVETKGERFAPEYKKLISDFLPPIIIKGVKKLLGK